MIGATTLDEAPPVAVRARFRFGFDLSHPRFGCPRPGSARRTGLLGRLLDLLGDSLAWFGAETRIALVHVSLALGDVGGARKLLADASRLTRRTVDVVVFRRWFDDVWNRFDGRAEIALAGMAMLTSADLRVLRFLPMHHSFHEIAQRRHVSSNTAKTHVHAIYLSQA